MRRPCTLPLLSLLVLTAGAVHAQHGRVGVKADLNASTYAGHHVPSSGYQLGATAGLLLLVPVNPHVELQAELLYQQQGARVMYTDRLAGTISVGDYTRTERGRLHYASVPVLGKLKLGSWSVVGGPQLSYLLDERRRTTSETRPVYGPTDPALLYYSATSTRRNTADYNRWELGYVAGFGYTLSSHFSLEARYSVGVTRVRKQFASSSGPVLGSDRLQPARNSSLQCQVSYLLAAL